MNFIFYDTETTGTDTTFDQILQFAAIRTDDDLRELDRFEIRCLLHRPPHFTMENSNLIICRVSGYLKALGNGSLWVCPVLAQAEVTGLWRLRPLGDAYWKFGESKAHWRLLPERDGARFRCKISNLQYMRQGWGH
jgi:DNA polymerase III epsilon subunit-like protein